MPLFDPKAKTISTYQKKIEDDKNSIKNHYYEIGKLYYDQYKDMSLDVTTDINSRCDNVTELYKDIKNLELKILYERGLKVCKNCGKENNLEYAFCFACGSRFDESDRTGIMQASETVEVSSEQADVTVVEETIDDVDSSEEDVSSDDAESTSDENEVDTLQENE